MAGDTQDLTRRARALRAAGMGVVVLSLLAAAGCSGGSDDAKDKTTTTAASTTEPAEPLPAKSECTDEAGDVKALAPSELDDVSSKTSDLVATKLARNDDVVDVSWTLTDGAVQAAEAGGNLLLAVEVGPVEERYPSAEVSVIRSADAKPALSLTTWDEQGEPKDDTDPKDVPVKISGDTITVSVPVERWAELFPAGWEWSATSTSSHADGKTQYSGEDACGTKDAGGGSKIVTFPGVDLS